MYWRLIVVKHVWPLTCLMIVWIGCAHRACKPLLLFFFLFIYLFFALFLQVNIEVLAELQLLNQLLGVNCVLPDADDTVLSIPPKHILWDGVGREWYTTKIMDAAFFSTTEQQYFSSHWQEAVETFISRQLLKIHSAVWTLALCVSEVLFNQERSFSLNNQDESLNRRTQ